MNASTVAGGSVAKGVSKQKAAINAAHERILKNQAQRLALSIAPGGDLYRKMTALSLQREFNGAQEQ